MKKKIFVNSIILLLVAMLLTSCMLSPLKRNDGKANSNMPNGIYHVKFSGDDVIPDGDELYINAEFFDYDKYKKAPFENLKVGDSFRTHDGTIDIKSKEDLQDLNGDVVGTMINGDIEDGGHGFIFDNDDNAYREFGMDYYYVLYSIGKAKIKVSKTVTMEDKTILDNPNDELEDDDIAKFDDILDKTATGEYYPNNTYFVIKNKEITNIVVEWVP